MQLLHLIWGWPTLYMHIREIEREFGASLLGQIIDVRFY